MSTTITHYTFPEYIGGYIFPQYIYKYSKVLKNTEECDHKSIKLPELRIKQDNEKKIHGNRRRMKKVKKVKMSEAEENEYNIQLALKYDEFYDMFEEDYLNVELMTKYFDEFCELCEILKIKLKNVIYMIKPQKYDIDKSINIIKKLEIENGIYRYAFINGMPNESDIIYSLLDDSISEEWLNFGTKNLKLTPLFINTLLSFDFETELKGYSYSYYNLPTKDLKSIYNNRIKKAISFIQNNILNDDKNKSLLMPTNTHNRIYFLTKDNYKHLINCDIFFKNMKKKRNEKLSKISETINFNVVPCIYEIPIEIFDIDSDKNNYNLNYYDDLDEEVQNEDDNIIYLDKNNNYKFNGFKHRNKRSFFSRRKSRNDVLVQRKDLYMLESINILNKNVQIDEFNNEHITYNIDESQLYMKNLSSIPNVGALYFTSKIDLHIIKFLTSIGYIIDISYMKYFLNTFNINDYVEMNPSYIEYLKNKSNIVKIDKIQIGCVEKPDYLYYDMESLYDENKLIQVFGELSKYIDFENDNNDNTLIYYCIIYNLVNTLKYVIEKRKNKKIEENILNKKMYYKGHVFCNRFSTYTLFEYVYVLNNANKKNEEIRGRFTEDEDNNNTYNKVYLNLSTLDYLVNNHNINLDSSFYEIKNISMIKYLLSKNVFFNNETLIYYLQYNYGLFNYFIKKLNYKLPKIITKNIFKFFNYVRSKNRQITIFILNDIICNKEIYDISEEEIKSSFNDIKNVKLFIKNYILNDDDTRPYILRIRYKNIAIYNDFIKHIIKYMNNYESLFDNILKICIKKRKCKIFSLFALNMPNFDINNYQNVVDHIKVYEETPLTKFYTFGTNKIKDYVVKREYRSNDSDDILNSDSEEETDEELNKITNCRSKRNVYNHDILYYLYNNEFNEADDHILLYNFENDNLYKNNRHIPNSYIYNSEKDIKSQLEEIKLRNKKEIYTWHRRENIRFEYIFENEDDSDNSEKYKDKDYFGLNSYSSSDSSLDSSLDSSSDSE